MQGIGIWQVIIAAIAIITVILLYKEIPQKFLKWVDFKLTLMTSRQRSLRKVIL
jgi:hypothetical protein